MKLTDKIVELVRETSSSLSGDVLVALRAALRREKSGSSAAMVIKTILENCALAGRKGVPLCQDTGMLVFFVNEALRRRITPELLGRAVAIATGRGYLRKNTIDSVTGRSFDDNCAEGVPAVRYCDRPGVTLMMKGGGSENMSRQYSLPDASLVAGRDMEGVRRCLIDAVVKAQGFGCAPGVLGVCIGGDRATGFEVAKEQLLRPLDRSGEADDAAIRRLERRVLKEANTLGIGPMGLGGRTTILGVRIASRPRVPASFFVTVAYMCWAVRRRTVLI